MIQEAKGSPTPMIGTMRPVSPTPSLKLMDDTPALEMTSISSSPSKEEDEEEEEYVRRDSKKDK